MGKFQLTDVSNVSGSIKLASIKVIGVGGGGCNAVRHMIRSGVINDIDFICANTDAQSLQSINGSEILQLGADTTKGLGAGLDPEVGRKAALEEREHLIELLKGTDMLFMATGLGGGTGTGSTPVIAEIAKELGIITVAVVSTPFDFEGTKRMEIAVEGIKELEKVIDSLIVIDNNKVIPEDKDVKLVECFAMVDEILTQALIGIYDAIKRPGMMNIDFADFKKIMQSQGRAIMGYGSASGSNRGIEAAKKAIENPLLDDIALKTAKGLLVNVSANEEIGMKEFKAIAEFVQSFASKDVVSKIGMAIAPELGDDLKVLIIATGLTDEKTKKPNNMRLVRAEAAMVNGQSQRRKVNSEVNSRFTNKQVPLDKNADYLDVPTWLRNQID